jgi:hypothetical protein
MNVKDQFLSMGTFTLREGIHIRLCEDIWLGNQTLRSQYPSLYNIVRKQYATVVDVLSSTPLNISFRRALVGDKLRDWHNLVARLLSVNI